MSDELIQTGATISPDGLYRYNLWRIWDKAKPYALFIGLNPSTADAKEDDPTIRRCKRFAADWGYGGVHMANLFAFRATKPTDMLHTLDPIGDQNDTYLDALAHNAGVIVCAWGANGGHVQRNKQVIDLLSDYDLCCLGKTKAGHPGHPLYIKANRLLERFI